MFDKGIQFPSVAGLSLALLCIMRTATADAQVYKITAHGKGTSAIPKVSMESSGESVNVVSKLDITVAEYKRENYIEIKADVYYKLNYGGLVAANNKKGWFGYSMSGLSHGGTFGKERFTLDIWCKGSGSDGFILRKKPTHQPEQSFIVGHISCKKR
ncbi:hypothetical protein [Candidatus Sororendozoicomonas aggregata]|uniref:hypothetical protein n=1 Tax=Candidatus Sororendozoicomonas aggregata TaxID=3073239 RepID=UPI002ED1B2B5